MTTLSRNIRRSPYAFYALAVFMGIFRFYNEWAAVTNIGDGGPMANLWIMVALYNAFAEAAYMVGTGAMLQILIAIFDKVKGAGE